MPNSFFVEKIATRTGASPAFRVWWAPSGAGREAHNFTGIEDSLTRGRADRHPARADRLARRQVVDAHAEP